VKKGHHIVVITDPARRARLAAFVVHGCPVDRCLDRIHNLLGRL
jgi:hypothetical protein